MSFSSLESFATSATVNNLFLDLSPDHGMHRIPDKQRAMRNIKTEEPMSMANTGIRLDT